MVSPPEPPQPKSVPDPISGPRISFSADFLDDDSFISINPKRADGAVERDQARNEFEFLSGDLTDIVTADELFREGKLLPFCWQEEKLKKIALKTTAGINADVAPSGNGKGEEAERRISWFLDDDPSPRPPKCTVLWKELLRLKKQRPSTLSPSSSSSSSSSAEGLERKKGGGGEREKFGSRVKKGLERTRSASMRIRPMINVPICTPARNPSLPPLFPVRRPGRLES